MRALLLAILIAAAGSAAAAQTDSVPSAAPPSADDWAADRYFNAGRMAEARAAMQSEHGDGHYSMVLADVAEVSSGGGYRWEGEASTGGDLHRFVLKTEGEGETDGKLERGEVQALVSRAIGPYYNLLAGARQDLIAHGRTYASVGLDGVAPYFIETEATAFLSNHGEVSGRLAAETDLRITQRLILQPRAEVNFALQNSRAIRVGAGLSEVEAGLRLRYEIVRQFAPYVGVNWIRSIGRTARYLRQAGEDRGDLSLTAGVRTWF